MANTGKKDNGGQQQGQRGELVRREPTQAVARDPFQMLMRDPFQLMREMMVDPFRMLSMMPALGGRELGWNVSFDVRETDDAFIIDADLPGIREDDLDIALVANQLQITGKREHEERQEKSGQLHSYERSYGSFSRAFSLPQVADLDNVRCDLKHGVLTVVVPKKPGSSPQRRKIQIGSGAKS